MSEPSDTSFASNSSGRSTRAAASKAKELIGILTKKKSRKRRKKEDSTTMAGIPESIRKKLTQEELVALEAAMVNRNQGPNQNGNRNDDPQEQNGNGNQQPLIIQMDGIVVRQPNPNVKIPKYIADKMTADHYLEEVKSYFASQGITKDLVASVSTILDPAMKAWFIHVRKEGMTWEEFEDSFKAKYDTWFDKQRRMNYLVNRMQLENEPIEDFVWELMSLSKQVFPQEPVADAVRRCRAALTPQLRCHIPDLLVWTPEALIERCKSAVHDMRDHTRQTGNTAHVPTINHPQQQGRFNQPYRGQRSNYNPSENGWNQHRKRASNFYQSSTSYHHGPRVTTPTQTTESWKLPIPTHPQTTEMSTYAQPTVPSQTGYQGQRKTNQIKCFKCNQMGHIARHCRSTAFFHGHGSDRQGQPNHHPTTQVYHQQEESHQSKNEEGRDQ
jgi:hypothetical protein